MCFWKKSNFLTLSFNSKFLLIPQKLSFYAGGSSTTKRLRNFYELFSSIAEVVPAAFFTTEILLKYGLREELRILLLALGLAPTAIEISSARIKDRSKLQRFTNAIYTVQSVALLLICEQHGNYGGMSLAASLGLMRFFSEDFCDQYEVPYTDLSQYSLSFIGFFGLVALKNL